MSGDMASRFLAVSKSVSPFTTLLVPPVMLRVSALRRFAASSNDVRVRVEASRKSKTTVMPLRAGTFLMRR